MSAQGRTYPTKVYPSVDSSYAPHSSGGGAQKVGYTGTTAGSIDCTALAGCYVELRSEVAATGADGALYRFCWITAAELAGAEGFSAIDAAAALNPATASKIPSKFGGALIVPQVVDRERPILLYSPYESVTLDTIVVAVANPHPTS